MNSITIDLCAKTVLDKRGSDVAQIWDLSAPRAKAHHAVRPKWAILVPTAWRTQRLDNRQTVFALALDLVLHDHFKYQLVMHRSILMKTSCSNISILHAASKQSRIKLHQNGCFHLVLPIYCITCFDCVGFTRQRGSLRSSLDGPVRPPTNLRNRCILDILGPIKSQGIWIFCYLCKSLINNWYQMRLQRSTEPLKRQSVWTTLVKC